VRVHAYKCSIPLRSLHGFVHQLEEILIFKAPNDSSLYGVKMVPIPLEAHANFIRAVTVAAETSFAQSGFMRDV
jgi:hypothetical protein